LVPFLRLFSVFPQCQGRSFSYDSTLLTTLYHSQRPSSTTKGSSFFPQRTLKHPFPSHTTSPTNREAPKNLCFSLTYLLVVVALHPSQWPSTTTKFLAFFLQRNTKHSKVPTLIFKYKPQTTFVFLAFSLQPRTRYSKVRL